MQISFSKIVSTLLLSLLLTSCEDQISMINPHQSVYLNENRISVGSSQNNNELDLIEVDNPSFGKNFIPFHSEKINLSSELNNKDEEAIWNWILEALEIYHIGVFSQSNYTDQQFEELSDWLSNFLDDKIKQERLEKAFNKVDGGYVLVNPLGIYDFHFNSIQEILQLTLKDNDETHFTLEANLIVRQDQEVFVSYTFEKRDNNWILVDYHFGLL